MHYEKEVINKYTNRPEIKIVNATAELKLDLKEAPLVFVRANGDFRGTYATKILNNGTEIKDVAILLGHRNIETTENYYITSLEDNRKNAVEMFDNDNKTNVIKNAIKFQLKEYN